MAKISHRLLEVGPTPGNTVYTKEEIQTLYDSPHILGWIAGKDKLREIHSDWIWYLWDPDMKDHRALRAFRGSYKTTSCGEIGPIWYWLFHDPNARIFVIRKDFTAASEILETVHSMMELPEIKSLFEYVHGKVPRATIKRKEKITYSFKKTVTPEGSLNAFGMDMGFTGKHGDKFYLDDFIDPRDRVSKAERERTKNVVREIMTNIVDPGKTVSFSGTPWHKEDAWEICPKPLDFDVNTPELSYILSPEEMEKKRRGTTSSLWAANYELKHVPQDSLFREPVWEDWKMKGIEAVYAHIDAAFDGDHWCALTLMALRHDGKIQAKGYAYPGNIKTWKMEACLIMRRYGVRKLFVEDNPDKGYVADDFSMEGIAVSKYTETMNKDVKISTYLVEAWPNIVWDSGTDAEYMGQILDYREKQEPNDCPDSCSSLIKHKYAKAKFARNERWKW